MTARAREGTAFLEWALPRLGLRWRGFEGVHGQVIKRAHRRARDLGLADLAAYRSHLESHEDEWPILDSFCRITISRFYREAAVFELLRTELLPRLAEGARAHGETLVVALCLGAAGGEEPYSLRIAWEHAEHQGVELSVVAIEADPEQLERARAGRYRPSAVAEVPEAFRTEAFARDGEDYVLCDAYRRGVNVEQGDVRGAWPAGPYDLVLCRNLAFTYFGDDLARETLDRIRAALRPGGVLVIGRQDHLPRDEAFEEARPGSNVFVLRQGGPNGSAARD